MICQSCNQREANVHITKIINGVKTEMHLCDECAKKQDVNVGVPLTSVRQCHFRTYLMDSLK
jgi:protein arginine kinase activator